MWGVKSGQSGVTTIQFVYYIAVPMSFVAHWDKK